MNNNVIKVKRLTTVATHESYPASYHLEDIDCYIEPVDPKVAVMFDQENAFKTFLCIINQILDIKESDLIEDQSGTEYRVGGIQKFENPEIENHMEITMYQKYEN